MIFIWFVINTYLSTKHDSHINPELECTYYNECQILGLLNSTLAIRKKIYHSSQSEQSGVRQHWIPPYWISYTSFKGSFKLNEGHAKA